MAPPPLFSSLFGVLLELLEDRTCLCRRLLTIRLDAKCGDIRKYVLRTLSNLDDSIHFIQEARINVVAEFLDCLCDTNLLAPLFEMLDHYGMHFESDGLAIHRTTIPSLKGNFLESLDERRLARPRRTDDRNLTLNLHRRIGRRSHTKRLLSADV